MRIVALALFAVACKGTAPDLITVPEAHVTADLTAAEFPGAATLLSGFDQRTGEAGWRPGDQMLFGLRLRKGASTRRWLLHLVVAPPKTSATADGAVAPVIEMKRVWDITWTNRGQQRQVPIESVMLPVAVTVTAEDAAVLGRSQVDLPAQLLGRGIVRAVEIFAGAITEPSPDREMGEEDIRSIGAALFGLVALLEVLQKDQVLAEYFWQVVEKPGIWSVISSLGVTVNLRLEFQKSVPAASLPAQLPALGPVFVAPLQIDVNNSPALLMDLVVTDAARPYAVSGGVVAIAARHPTQAGVRLDAVLLAARLAP